MAEGPLVSIGLPVFNGERYLESAIQSILEQQYVNLELVVSDNASTDRTHEILEEWARRDERIRLHRNNVNVGAAANFNRVFELAEGQYFHWSGHDDLLHSRMIGLCVETLEDVGPDYVIAFPDTMEIDGDGNKIGIPQLRLEVAQDSPASRYRQVVRYVGKAHPIFGLIRTDAIRSTGGLERFPSADLVLIAKLALRGKFIRVPETLFFRRIHPGASWRAAGKYEGFARWFDPDGRQRIVFPSWRLWREFTLAPMSSSQPIYVKIDASLTAAAIWGRRRHRRMLSELVRPISMVGSPVRPSPD